MSAACASARRTQGRQRADAGLVIILRCATGCVAMPPESAAVQSPSEQPGAQEQQQQQLTSEVTAWRRGHSARKHARRRGRGRRLEASTRHSSCVAHAGRSRDRFRPQMGQPQRRHPRGETREHAGRGSTPRPATLASRSVARRSALEAPLTALLRLDAARASDSATPRRRVLKHKPCA